jgi:hypothetical protein
MLKSTHTTHGEPCSATQVKHSPLETVIWEMEKMGYEFKSVEEGEHKFIRFEFKEHDVIFAVHDAGCMAPSYEIRSRVKGQCKKFQTMHEAFAEAEILIPLFDI